jgi:hypothetical protein
MMSSRARAPSRLTRTLAVALLGTTLFSVMRSAHAQDGAQDPPYSHGVAAEIGGDWLVAVQSAALTVIPLSQTTRPQQQMLRLSLQVQNAGAEARLFPLSRLRLLGSSGTPLRDTWCGRDASPLELSDQVPPKGLLMGDVCWAVDAAEAANVVLSVAEPVDERRQEPAVFAVNPIESIAAQAPPAPTAAALSNSTDTVADGSAAVPTTRPTVLESPGTLATATARTLARPAPSGCAPAYSAYADAQGSYLTPECPVAERGREGSGAAVRAPGVPPSELYPSANQPSSRNSPSLGATPTPGPALTATSYLGTSIGPNGERR